MNMDTTTYRTKDLAEAAALVTTKHKLIEITREGYTCWFIFENQKLCKKLSDQYFFGELLLNAREFHEVITRLKSRIFSR
jgi:hypothetical protein